MANTQLIARQLQDTALRYFLEVARCGSISEASTRLNVASSAISRHIAQLEALLEVSLFDRHARGMLLSSAGELLATHAIRSAHDAERVVGDVHALEGVKRGHVRIVSSEGFAMEFLPRVIGNFLEKHPGIQFHLVVHPPAECMRCILLNDADIGVVMSRGAAKDIRIEHLQPSPVMAVMRPGHPLVKLRQIGLRQLEPYPLALPEPDTTVRQLFDIACNRQQIKVEPVLTSNYMTSLLAFLRHAPLGVSICGEISVRDQIHRGELVALPLKDRGLDLRNIEVQTLMGRNLPRAAIAFLDFLVPQLVR